ncbi:PREDICTED: tumor necrosis factor receptor superfamily member 5-like isoform X1 [Cyprinodon variegatus]|uniref:tumor necrosis factor receptor superfamily member 5-like isoform X1 n=1 Tax=Cyprinodon variegatus TaxID=28743 RepID=UPI000742812F|nr:PREDICTED: tumor necrosis factor receptor superfamily member 5-like isoform X1 [Cyprinodon variegatus]
MSSTHAVPPAECSVIHPLEAMKNKLVLLVVLLALNTNKVHPMPYKQEAGNCRNSETEYWNEEVALCCKKCPPGHRMKQECTETADTQCEPCGLEQYIEDWNYSPNCLSCTKCKSKKGLEYAQTCTSTRNSKCVCKTGTFCYLGFDDPYCTDCKGYKLCKPGERVSVEGTRNSDRVCEKCPTNPCSSPSTITVSTVVTVNKTSTTPPGPKESTQTVKPILTVRPTSPEDPPTSKMVAVIASAAGILLLLIFVICLLTLCKRKWTKDSGNLPHKVDANGNCETAIKQNGHSSSSVESPMTSLPMTSQEQVCLLAKGEVSSDQSLSSSDTETSIRTDGFSRNDSLRPLQPTLGIDNPSSVLSEPMVLQSFTEPMAHRPSLSTQGSSQPTSPLIVSPLTNSPHVNVNITLHIGNGSCGTPSFQPTDVNQSEYQLPFGQEEESVSSPQQEAGKLSLISVQESPTVCT